jgi:hypothetical protein
VQVAVQPAVVQPNGVQLVAEGVPQAPLPLQVAAGV